MRERESKRGEGRKGGKKRVKRRRLRKNERGIKGREKKGRREGLRGAKGVIRE